MPGVKYVIFFEVVNDLIASYGGSSGPPAKDPRESSRRPRRRCSLRVTASSSSERALKARGLGVTLTPYGRDSRQMGGSIFPGG